MKNIYKKLYSISIFFGWIKLSSWAYKKWMFAYINSEKDPNIGYFKFANEFLNQ